jgi:hypothetical protein
MKRNKDSKSKKQENLLEFIPRHSVDWEKNDDNRIILLVPKFQKPFLVKHVLPRLKNPNMRVTLDDFGTFVWKNIDGEKSVHQIGAALHDQFGENVEPVFERLGMFIRQLVSMHCLALFKKNK